MQHLLTEKVNKKYTLDGSINFEENDVVVDVGAYVGSLGLEIAPDVYLVIAIDPNSTNDSSLSENTRELENVFVVPKAAWYEPDNLNLNLSITANDNSILSVDENDAEQSVTVSADTVTNIARKFGIDRINFLKVEAEGAEPEVLEGALDGSIPINKISVDCASEPEGSSPRNQIVSVLEEYGYTVRLGWNGWVVYAEQREVMRHQAKFKQIDYIFGPKSL